jgi:hypothetical protein
MPAEEGNLVGGPPALIDGDDCKSASSAGFPVHGNVFGVCLGGMSASFARSRARQADLDQVGIPSVLGDTQVIVALLLGGCQSWSSACMHVYIPSLRPVRRRGLFTNVSPVSMAGACIVTHDTWKLSQSDRPCW